jgi:taurine dioxygenase
MSTDHDGTAADRAAIASLPRPPGRLKGPVDVVSDYSTMTVTPLTPAIGARIDGIDLHRPLDPAQREEINRALMEHLVLFLRGQDLDEDEHLAFAGCFGPPRAQSVAAGGEPMWFVTVEDTPASPPKADHWHTDMAFVPDPPDIAVLNMREMPPLGGDTLWVSLYAVYEGLSRPIQQLLGPLEAEHGVGAQLIRHAGESRGEEYQQQVRQSQSVRHPLVRQHPRTGKLALYFGGTEFTRGIAGMHPDESEALLQVLRTRLDDPNVQCRWRWEPYDVAVWDERCTNHRALSDHYPGYRCIRRCLVGHGRPAAAAAPAATAARA